MIPVTGVGTLSLLLAWTRPPGVGIPGLLVWLGVGIPGLELIGWLWPGISILGLAILWPGVGIPDLVVP